MAPPTRLALASLPAHAALLCAGGALLVICGQPLFTDDMWWHLALGRAYASEGPWLAADPLLYTATGPPAPAAWLSDWLLYVLHWITGYEGLRVAHALGVAAILAFAWSLLRRASSSVAVASLGTLAFVALSAYRLFQLRPHLLTILATFACYRLLLEAGTPPSRRRIAAAAVLLAVWANLHGAFLLGPILLVAGLCGIGVAAAARDATTRGADRRTAAALGIALLVGLLATLLNADGIDQHLAYFAAGAASPELGWISDEWQRADLFAAPPANLPPSATAWALLWGLTLATPIAGLHALWRWRSGGTGGPAPALLGVAGAGLFAALLAVRFFWLALFPMLLIAAELRAARPHAPRAALRALAASACALLIAAGFFLRGDWSMIDQGWPPVRGRYRQPYPSAKYSGIAVDFLEDTRLSGNLFNEYFQGGFLAYRLAPRLRAFVNGSLNVPNEVMTAYAAIRQVRGVPDDESFAELLDRMEVDVFLGNRMPQLPRPNRPPLFTTAHLEATPGWVQVFRNLTSAVYVRDNPRNAENLARVARWYAGQGIPYDPARGFEPALVLDAADHWAIRHGLAPVSFDQLVAARYGAPPAVALSATARLASIYATLGAYERALALDRQIVEAQPNAFAAHRRIVWSLLRLDRAAEAHAAAEALRRAPRTDALAQMIARAAKRNANTPRDDVRRQIAARLPVFTRAEASALTSRVVSGPPRPPRLGQDAPDA